MVAGQAAPAGSAALGVQRVPWPVWGLSAIIVLGAFGSMLTSTIVNVALPSIGSGLHASHASTQWVATGYLLALAAGVPFSGWAARRVGATRVWLGALAAFGVFSIWCAESGTIQLLVAGRVLQGLAGGLLVPAGQTIAGVVAGRERLGRVMSTVGVAVVVAPTLGTTLGSVIFDRLGWAWLFWVNIPLAVVAFAAGAAWLPRVQSGEPGRLDWLGLLLVLSGLPLLTYGVSAIGNARGLGSLSADGYTGGGAVLLIGFTVWSLRTATPLLQLRLLSNGVFCCGALVMFFGGAINFGAQVVLPLYFVQTRHESLLAAGLLIGPQVIGTAVGFPLAGRLTDRYGGGFLLLGGGAVTALATIPLALVRADTNYTWLGLVLLVRGFGVALGTIPAMTAGLAAVSQAQLPDAAALLNMLQRSGASIGTAVIAILYSSHLPGRADPVHAAHAFRYVSWWLFAGACLLTLPASLLTRAERTARRRRSATPTSNPGVTAVAA